MTDREGPADEECRRAPGGFCHPTDTWKYCLVHTAHQCLVYHRLTPTIHLTGSTVASIQRLMGTFDLACLASAVDAGADVRLRPSGEFGADRACMTRNRAMYVNRDDPTVVLWYGPQDALGGAVSLHGSVYADETRQAWNVGRIQQICSGSGNCRLGAEALVRAHSSAFIPEQIDYSWGGEAWTPTPATWLAWDGASQCWVHDHVHCATGRLPLAPSVSLGGIALLGVLCGAFLALDHPLARRLWGLLGSAWRCLEGAGPGLRTRLESAVPASAWTVITFPIGVALPAALVEKLSAGPLVEGALGCPLGLLRTSPRDSNE